MTDDLFNETYVLNVKEMQILNAFSNNKGIF